MTTRRATLLIVTILCVSSMSRAADPLPSDPKARLAQQGTTVFEPQREIPVTHRADVVVIGAAEGGLGGCTAAIAATRHGATALLIEKGGTVGLHVPIAMGVVIGIKGWQPTIREGLFREFAETVARTGQYHHAPVTPEEILSRGEIIIRRHEVVSTAMLAMLQKAGVQTIFHAKLVDAVVEDGKLEAVIVESPQGRHAIAGKVFIDSTGLGDVAAKAGAPMLREEPFMSVQAFIGGVDEPKYRKWADEDKQPLDDSYKTWIEKLVGPLAGQKYPWDQWWPEYLGDRMPPAVVRKVREAQEKGEFTLIHRRGQEGVLAIVEGIKSNTGVAMPRTYITGIDPFNVDDVSWAEVTSRMALMDFQQFLLKQIPGFENSFMERVAETVSLRGGRYIEIDKQLTRDEIDGGAKNADCIYVFSRGKDHVFEVPYRALVPKNVDGLLVVGKATAGGRHLRTAHGVLFQGQAAGTAAAM
ncbi:MAG: FAD-dependent oxidoreductase, partial [Tepidisphaeraceae bacterium]